MNDMFTCVKWCTPDILSISSFPGDKTQLQWNKHWLFIMSEVYIIELNR